MLLFVFGRISSALQHMVIVYLRRREPINFLIDLLWILWNRVPIRVTQSVAAILHLVSIHSLLGYIINDIQDAGKPNTYDQTWAQ